MLTLLKLMIQLHYNFHHCNIEKTEELCFLHPRTAFSPGVLQRQLNSILYTLVKTMEFGTPVYLQPRSKRGTKAALWQKSFPKLCDDAAPRVPVLSPSFPLLCSLSAATTDLSCGFQKILTPHLTSRG